MAHRKVSLACGIPCCVCLLLFLLPNQCLCVVTMFMYTHICVEIVYELLLLPSNTAHETFLHKLEQYEMWTVINGTLLWQ